MVTKQSRKKGKKRFSMEEKTSTINTYTAAPVRKRTALRWIKLFREAAPRVIPPSIHVVRPEPHGRCDDIPSCHRFNPQGGKRKMEHMRERQHKATSRQSRKEGLDVYVRRHDEYPPPGASYQRGSAVYHLLRVQKLLHESSDI